MLHNAIHTDSQQETDRKRSTDAVDTCLAMMQMSNQRNVPDEVGIVHYVSKEPSLTTHTDTQ